MRMKPAPWIALSLLAGLVAFAAPAAACDIVPVVTIGGQAPPAPGVYLLEGCNYGAGESDYGASAEVNPIFVLGQPVPGTGMPVGADLPSTSVPLLGVAECGLYGSAPVEPCAGANGFWAIPTAAAWKACSFVPAGDRDVTFSDGIGTVSVHCDYTAP